MKSSWKRSNPLINISKNQIEELPYFKNKSIMTVEVFHTGLKNTNYLVGLYDSTVVLRLSRDTSRMEIELNLINKLKDKVSVPAIIDSGTLVANNNEITYLIMDYISGELFSEIKEVLEEKSKSHYYRLIGEELLKICQVKFDETGFFKPNLSIQTKLENSVQGYAEIFKELVVKPGVKGNLGPLYFDLIEFVQANQSFIKEVPTAPILCHGDFNPENILINQTEMIVEAVLDWEFTLVLNPFLDIGNFLRFEDNLDRHYIDSFINPLKKNLEGFPENWKILARLYDIIALISMVDGDKVERNRLKDITERLKHYLGESY